MTDTSAEIRSALAAGLNPQALDLARDALLDGQSSPEIHYLGALASARMGAFGEAEQWLAKVDREALGNSPLAVEAWALAGRIAKERFASARDPSSPVARERARAAMGNYLHAFALSGEPYPAVNAATMARLAGDVPQSRDLAQRALNAVREPDDHWGHATAGEALLLLDRIVEARAHYAAAFRRAGARFGDIASMRRQLQLLGTDAAAEVASELSAPLVIAFSGHMIDVPGRPTPRFPAALEARVAEALRARIATLGTAIGYAQAACGADILFLEAMQDAGYQTQVVLPFLPADYIRTSVAFAGAAWATRFERALHRATRVVLATEEPYLDDDVLFEHAANLIHGMAFLRAHELATQPLMLTVHEYDHRQRVGGTGATARNWTCKGGRVENIELAELRGNATTNAVHAAVAVPRAASAALTPSTSTTPDTASATSRTLQSLLFADISGFTRMPEQYTPDFAAMFLGTCKGILDALEHPPIEVNTFGDGLFAVFQLPSHAADFAVRLQQALWQVDWRALGLAPETGARVALHTGPLFAVFNAVLGRRAFYGTHINRTARLEPIVQPGHIFVTEEFAASLVADDQQRFHCDYIGSMALAKKYGDARLYRLRCTEAT